jgi:2-amino-4-hydroxy-6-hydroxymethyldihydropteridine diphosphokinase
MGRPLPIRKAENDVLIALGANLPGADGAPPRLTLERALTALASLPGLRLVAAARWVRTPADPPLPGAPDFLNGVARLRGAAGDPERLLERLHAIEAAAGRVRSVPNAPRTLDLDIIAIDDWVIDPPARPVLPHPRADRRRFVLQPLAEVAPGWRHPRLGRSVETLLAQLPGRPAPLA